MDKMKLKQFKRFDLAESLRTEEDILIYLKIIMEEDNLAEWVHALEVVARARGMTQMAQDAGVDRSVLFSQQKQTSRKALRDAMTAMVQTMQAKAPVVTEAH